MSDVTWWKPIRDASGAVSGYTREPAVVGRTGKERADVAHDEGRRIAPSDPSSRSRADDHPDGVEDSIDFHDRPGQGNRKAER